MNVSLTPQLEQFVSEKVETGMYETASEVVREGLRLLKERDQQNEDLDKELRAGLEDLRRGAYTEYDESTISDLARRVKERGRKRLAAETSTSTRSSQSSSRHK